MVLRGSISDSYIPNVDGLENTSTDEVTLLGVCIDNKFKNYNMTFFIKRQNQVTCECFY